MKLNIKLTRKCVRKNVYVWILVGLYLKFWEGNLTIINSHGIRNSKSLILTYQSIEKSSVSIYYYLVYLRTRVLGIRYYYCGTLSKWNLKIYGYCGVLTRHRRRNIENIGYLIVLRYLERKGIRYLSFWRGDICRSIFLRSLLGYSGE